MTSEAQRAAPLLPQVGELFADKYRIERVLGTGGMGHVVEATHVQLRERVAIKLLLPENAADPTLVERFLQEGRAAARIRSAHVCRVHDVGATAAGIPYIVMEHLDGDDLGRLLKRDGPLTIGTAVDYVIQACDAIGEAHALRIIHRDLKPSNLFLVTKHDGRKTIKVLDFGISKALDRAPDESVTATTTAIGTPAYMSPEQLRSAKHVDARTDIWSLGIALFELVAGRRPFRASSIAELHALILTGTAPDIRTVAPQAPEDFAAVIRRCLQRNVDDRFVDVGELVRALEPFRFHDEPATTLAAVTAADETRARRSDAPTQLVAATSAAEDTRTVRLTKRIGIPIAIAVAFASGWIAMMSWRPAPTSTPTVASSPTPPAATTAVTPLAPEPVPATSTAASVVALPPATTEPPPIPPTAPAKSVRSSSRPTAPRAPGTARPSGKSPPIPDHI